MLDRKRCDEAPLRHDETTPGRAEGTFTLSRDYEDVGGPTRFLRPEGRAWATGDRARSDDDDGDACRWASKQGDLPTREIIAPPCAAGAHQTRPRLGDDVS